MKTLIYMTALLVAIMLSHNTPAQKEASDPQARPAKDSASAQLQKAKLLVQQGNRQEASKILTGIMATQPDNKEAVQWWLIANMKRTPTGEVDAIPMLDSLGKVYPANTGILFFKTFIQAEHGMNREALANADKLISDQPDTAVNWILKGQILQGMDRHKEACEAFEKAVKLDPSRTDVVGMEASSLLKSGQPEKALELVNKGIELDPENASNFYNRACIYCLNGDKGMALSDLKKAFTLNPELKKFALRDSDLQSLYEDEAFKELMK